jgi:hypothetical protein
LPRKDRGYELDLEEYRQILEMDRHLTSLNWHIASILLGGVLAALGFTLSRNSNPFDIATLFIAILGCFGVSFWFLFAKRNHEIVRCGLIRAREIERFYRSPTHGGRFLNRGHKATQRDGEEDEIIHRPFGFTVLKLLTITFLAGLALIAFFSVLKLL